MTSTTQTDSQVLQQRILFVDLDNTLLATDVLWESIFLLMKRYPLVALLLPLWVLRGKVYLKQRIVQYVRPLPHLLPLNSSVVQFLQQQKEQGRTIVLATASHRIMAEPIARHVGLFDDILATTDGVNLGGSAKLAAMKEYAGKRDFEYIGDRGVDIPIWRECAGALVVNPTPSLERRAGVSFTHRFHEKRATLATYLKALRVHQWAKNFLLFLPLLMAHKLSDFSLILQCALAFCAFSFCASGVYVLNDLLDLESDREHPRKRKRPFASGLLPVQRGILLLPLLFLTSALICLMLPPKFGLALMVYFVLTTAYSFYLKQVVIVDVLMLAGLYTFRIIAGGYAAGVPVSRWMLAFSMFLFLSLAFIKRYTELRAMMERNQERAKGRDYTISDSELILSIGPASGYLAVLVLALYINSTDVATLYSNPSRLWLIEPFLLYWITRAWFLAHRNEMHDDPLVFALKDKASYIVGAMIAVVVILATT